jgi:hypothetical protein
MGNSLHEKWFKVAGGAGVRSVGAAGENYSSLSVRKSQKAGNAINAATTTK